MTRQTSPMPAGWYPDPSGQPGKRYHDGQRWTQLHFTPIPPAVAVAVSNGRGTNHALHAVLTLLTLGLWLPVWILVAIFGAGRSSSSVAVGTGGAIANAGFRRFRLLTA